MMARKPSNKIYCGMADLLFNDQAAQISTRIPRGPNILTPKIARLSQSSPKNLPVQYSEKGQTARESKTIAAKISSHANDLSTHISLGNT